MKYTNKLGLPQAIVNAITNDSYKSGSDCSVTQLTNSPRQFWLKKRHDNDIEVDVSSRIWALFGTSVHHVLDASADENAHTEERLYVEVEGWKIGGKPDYFDEEKLQDYKVTSVWTVMFDSNKRDYVVQLNIYNYILSQHSYTSIKCLENVFILRDWHESQAKRDSAYPQANVHVVQQELWRVHDTVKLITERVKLFQAHENTPDEQLPLCEPEERWAKQDKWALKKEGRKSAIKVCDSAEEANALLGQKHKGADSIEFRPGGDVKCQNYCDCKDFCSYYKENYTNK